MATLSIKSVVSDAVLEVTPAADVGYLLFSLRSKELCVSRRVYNAPGTPELLQLFLHMGAQSSPWTGSIGWGSCEGDAELDTECDATGHVRLRLKFREYGGKEPWSVETRLWLELGQLPALARSAEEALGGLRSNNSLERSREG